MDPSLPQNDTLRRGSACLPCRRRKQKCTAERPSCGQCVRGSRQCQYDLPQASLEERLQRRVDALENLVASYSQITPVHGYVPGNPQSQVPLAGTAPGGSGHGQYSSYTNVPPELVDHLLATFFKYSYQFNFPGNEPNFRAAMQFPSSDPRSPHPSLLNAMLLVACRWSNRGTLELETYLSNKAVSELNNSQGDAARLINTVLAASLLCRYSLLVGQLARASYLASSALMFAKSCGLHRLPVHWDDRSPDEGTMFLLPPPQSKSDFCLRISVWWSVYLLDKDVCHVCGIASSVLDEEICTPWPSEFAFFENANAGMTLPHVFVSNQMVMNIEDLLICMKAKAVALHDAARREYRWLREGRYRTWQDYVSRKQHLEAILSAFQRSLASVDPKQFLSSVGSRNNLHTPDVSAIHHTLLFAHSSLLAAQITLHLAGSERTGDLRAARENAYLMAALVRRGMDVDRAKGSPRTSGQLDAKDIYWHCGPCWDVALGVLREEQSSWDQGSITSSDHQSAVRAHISVLSHASKRLQDFARR
ncbi:uncharacterized protein EI90DRAFT_178380 [Cantharellus anzutake]|uniref:uncharacterized protein n=1 Tax=Cantharellus anzutake TaxID=1750568 RepID=UPI00190377FB|nr:uncharacterized protein EI90DRAFT_178380 [Cantharellus anzutake]KAF8336464.1 hypothetical protein EI90DRAFT_178380 [Cantharellus anzutake]